MNNLYFSGKYQDRKEDSFPYDLDIVDAGQLQEAIAISDYSFSKFTSGYRKKDVGKTKLIQFHRSETEFISSSWLYADVDNKPGQPYLSIDECVKQLSGVKFYITTSKSHGLMKDGIVAERYHILFPLDEEITELKKHKQLLKALHEQIFERDVLDSACTDSSRLFFGNKNNTTYFYDGESIQNRLNEAEEIETVKEEIKPQKYYEKKEITEEELKDIYPYLVKIAKTNHFDNYQNLMELGFAMKNAGYGEDDYYNLVPDKRMEQAQHIWECGRDSFTIATLIYLAKQVGYKKKERIDVYLKKKNFRNYKRS